MFFRCTVLEASACSGLQIAMICVATPWSDLAWSRSCCRSFQLGERATQATRSLCRHALSIPAVTFSRWPTCPPNAYPRAGRPSSKSFVTGCVGAFVKHATPSPPPHRTCPLHPHPAPLPQLFVMSVQQCRALLVSTCAIRWTHSTRPPAEANSANGRIGRIRARLRVWRGSGCTLVAPVQFVQRAALARGVIRARCRSPRGLVSAPRDSLPAQLRFELSFRANSVRFSRSMASLFSPATGWG